MQLTVVAGPEAEASLRLEAACRARADMLQRQGIGLARLSGRELIAALADPGRVLSARADLRIDGTTATERFCAALGSRLAADCAVELDRVLVFAPELAQDLRSPAEVGRLARLLGDACDTVRVALHVDGQHRAAIRHYARQLREGRRASLDAELDAAARESWEALPFSGSRDPRAQDFEDVQDVPPWLDYAALDRLWRGAFTDALCLRGYVQDAFSETDELEALTGAQGLALPPQAPPDPPSAASLTRARHMNVLLSRAASHLDLTLPRDVWSTLIDELAVPGPPIPETCLAALLDRFQAGNAALAETYGLSSRLFDLDGAPGYWQEADPGFGFRASQYLLASMWRIERACKQAEKQPAVAADPIPEAPTNPLLPPGAVEKLTELQTSPFAPHNQIGAADESAGQPAFGAVQSPEGSRRTIIACMKNEAPYIVEWLAHHRIVGFDRFLIYTNDCTDGTDRILARLAQMGLVEHRSNDDWRGKSPQQHALNRALGEPCVRTADWIAHIDVDEFVNVRVGNGTLDDFLERVPDATHVAMTWRLFGNAGVEGLGDAPVTATFTRCAPKYCPKPHTAWGFKTLGRNLGAYGKLSCHRPNKLDPQRKGELVWVNGSGRDMTREVAARGWRNSVKSVGYDWLQLNHYALRSEDSFLIKRDRGRALHVDRTIGLNYWIRMDWSAQSDHTITRGGPRLQAEMDRLLSDPELSAAHLAGRDWHRAKAEELRARPDLAALLDGARRLRLTDLERAAYALALDMES